MEAEALFRRQCNSAIQKDGSADAQQLVNLIIDTYRAHNRQAQQLEQRAVTLLAENDELKQLLASTNGSVNEWQQLFDLVLSNLPLGLSVFDAEQRLSTSNTRFRQLFGLEESDVAPGTSMRALMDKFPGKEQTGDNARSKATTPDGKCLRQREWAMNDGSIIQSVVSVLPDGSSISIHADITKERKAAERIAYLAHHDPLTGLPNRMSFHERIDAALAARKPDEQIALVHLNLDRFKSVNNTLGLSAGDKILRQVAERISMSAGPGNIVARLGSDEFAILQCGRQQPWNVTALAEQIRRELSEPFFRGDKAVELSVSMGIAICPQDAIDTDTLLKHAGVALAHAKLGGSKSERFFTAEMEAQIEARHRLEADLRKAIENEEFELYYQPLYDLQQQRICGFEALIRWNHPARGRVPPMEFIPLAEEVGLIVDIGRWVLRRACLDAIKWPEDIKVSVNVSAIQFTSSDLTEDVLSALAEAKLAPARLEIEITESVLMENLDESLPILHSLKQQGIRIAMDDFGTGYSSLSHLSSFPFDKIKIDKSFVADIVDNKEAFAIMRAIILMGDALGMRVTVEGVEAAEQLALLKQEACDEIQGYHISPPRPVAEVPCMLSGVHTQTSAKAG